MAFRHSMVTFFGAHEVIERKSGPAHEHRTLPGLMTADVGPRCEPRYYPYRPGDISHALDVGIGFRLSKLRIQPTLWTKFRSSKPVQIPRLKRQSQHLKQQYPIPEWHPQDRIYLPNNHVFFCLITLNADAISLFSRRLIMISSANDSHWFTDSLILSNNSIALV